MEKPTKKLWRKIGLQKNFLQGTSHSDQSKNTLSQIQNSLIKSHCSHSPHPSSNQDLKATQKRYQVEGNDYDDKKDARKQYNFDECSCQTPIDKLNSSNFEQRYKVWEQADKPLDSIKEKTESGLRFSSDDGRSPLYLQSINTKQEKDKQHANKSIKNESAKFSKYYESLPAKKVNESEQVVFRSYQVPKKETVEQIKIRLHSADEKQLQNNQQHQIQNAKNNGIAQNKESLYKYTLQIQPKQLQKYQKIEKLMNRVRSQQISRIRDMVVQIKKCFNQQKNFVQDELALMKRFLQENIIKEFSGQIQQLTDQIGYLYSQNEELMRKIQQKESLIKIQSQEQSKLRQKLSETDQKLKVQNEEKEGKLVSLQNEINRLQQKLQDVEQLQTKNQNLIKQNQQLQSKIQSLISNQTRLNDLLTQKAVQLTNKEVKGQQLQWEINQLYIKNEELEYKLRKQFAQQFQKLQNQQIGRLNLEKTFVQKEKIKNRQIQLTLNIVQTVLEQSLKHINLPTIQMIRQKFIIDKYENLKKIFDKAAQEAQQMMKTLQLNRENRIHLQSNQLSPRSDAQNKNLRTTGFFGQVTKPTLNIRLDDIQKRYSTQIAQEDQNFNQPNVYFDKAETNLDQRKSLFRGDTFSDISQESSNKEDYGYRSKLTSYPRNQQKRWGNSRQKHIRYESDSFKGTKPHLSEQITEDLNRIKNSFQQDLNNKNLFSNSFNSKVNQNTNEIANYSFSELNFNGFDSSDDRQSVTTYERSQTQRYPSKSYNYQRPPTEKSNSDRQDIIQKIKQRVKQKLRSKQKYSNEPSYNSQVQSSYKRKSYQESEYEEPKYQEPIAKKREDMILADFYEKHSVKNIPISSQTINQRKLSPHSSNRSPSNTRSRSPSNSSVSRTSTHLNRPTTNKYTVGSSNYVNLNKTTTNATTTRTAFSKSLIQKPQFVAYSRKTNPITTTTTATYQSKAPLYSFTKGQTPAGSSYTKKY